MSCKRVTKGVAARVFYNASLTHSRFYSLLQNALVNMMPSLLAGLFVYPAVFLGEELQPAEFFCHLLRAFSHTVTKLNRKFFASFKMSDYGRDLFFCKHYRNTPFMLCVNNFLKVVSIFMPHVAEVEKQSRQSLILRRSAYMIFYSKISQKLIYFFLTKAFKICVIGT